MGDLIWYRRRANGMTIAEAKLQDGQSVSWIVDQPAALAVAQPT